MADLDLLEMLPPPKPQPARLGDDVPAPAWHGMAWRPAGSSQLAERWLRMGEVQGPGTPPNLKRRR